MKGTCLDDMMAFLWGKGGRKRGEKDAGVPRALNRKVEERVTTDVIPSTADNMTHRVC